MMKTPIIILLTFMFTAVLGQRYTVPDWLLHQPPGDTATVFGIGISEPRTTNDSVAIVTATHKALATAVLLHKAKVSYASDFFAKNEAGQRRNILKQSIEELAHVEAHAYIDTSNFKVIDTAKNKNNEIFVLVAFKPITDSNANFFVTAEAYSKNFEQNNTSSTFEFNKNIVVKTLWLNQLGDSVDTIRTSYEYNNFTRRISATYTYNDSVIEPPTYVYEYELPPKFMFPKSVRKHIATDLCMHSSLTAGVWNAFADALIQVVVANAKNLASKISVVGNDYDDNREHNAATNISRPDNESLARSVGSVNLETKIVYINIKDNSLLIKPICTAR